MALHRKVVLLLLMVLAVISLAGGKKAPSCRALRSHKNKPPKNGRVSVGKSFLKYSCKNGYKLIGDAKRYCKKGKVIGRPPQCVRNVTCGEPILRNGIVRGVDFTVGERIKYKCKRGYRMISGDESSKCMRNGKWSNKKPTCEKILCSPAYISLLPANGNVTTTDPTNSLGAKVYFECKDNYELVGVDTLTCANSGRWDRSRPYCRAIKCPHPGQLPNGMVAGTNDLKIGSKITFTCSSGYRLLGSRMRTCQENRRWDGSLTVCDSGNFHCPTLGKPIKGEKHGDQYNQGDVVKFSCEDGYVLRGSSVRVCLQSGTWNGTEAYCIDEQQARYKDANETARLIRENLLDTVMEYTCTDDNSTCNATLPSDVDARARKINVNAKTGMDFVFVLDGSSSIRKHDFGLGLDFAQGLVRRIGANRRPGLPVARFAAVTYGSEAQLEFNLGEADVDSTEKTVNRIGNIQRVMGGTNSEAALQEVIDVVVPFAREGKRFLMFITDGRSNIGGPPERIATKLREEHNFEIFGIGVGDKINRRQLAGVASLPYEEHVIEVESFEALKKGLEKAVKIKPDYSPCGVGRSQQRARIVDGQESQEGAWPWMVRMYRSNGGKEQLVCGGALIQRRWVLTAAHCFYEWNRILRKRVSLADNPVIFNLVLGDHDTKTVVKELEQDRRVQKIFLHESYDDARFENDIALIKLNDRAKLTKSVRTLCLPNQDLAIPGKRGFVAGWGGIKNVLPGKESNTFAEKLQESDFIIQNDSLCKKTTDKYVNSNVTFCAGDGEGKKDSCHGDSGGPFSREGLVKEEKRQYRWMAAGLVSWGEGCAQKGNYGYYTRVWPFVDWVNKTIKANNDDDE